MTTKNRTLETTNIHYLVKDQRRFGNNVFFTKLLCSNSHVALEKSYKMNSYNVNNIPVWVKISPPHPPSFINVSIHPPKNMSPHSRIYSFKSFAYPSIWVEQDHLRKSTPCSLVLLKLRFCPLPTQLSSEPTAKDSTACISLRTASSTVAPPIRDRWATCRWQAHKDTHWRGEAVTMH